MTLSLADIYLGLGGRQLPPDPSAVSIDDFVIDSRQATPNSCFIAFVGEHTDGHLYIDAAIERGAGVIIAQHIPAGIQAHAVHPTIDPVPPQTGGVPVIFVVEDSLAALQQLAVYWRSRHNPTIIGITGSVGKTSSKELIAAVLRQRYATIWNEGNLNNEIGLPLTLLRIETEHEYAVLEMGFYVEGEITQLCGLAPPQIGIITNLGPIHLERAGSMEAIFRGKSELVRALPHDGCAVLNWDDAWVRRMADLSPAPIFRYGLTPESDLWADKITSAGLEGIRFRFNHRTASGKIDELHVHLPLLGQHSVHTALSAAAAGLLNDLSWEEIIIGLKDVEAQLRIEITPGINNSTLIDDTYNASPPSTIAALNLLDEMTGRHIAVLGDMLELGSYEQDGHRMVGRRAADVADILVAVGQRSRWIAEEAVASGLSVDQVHHTNAIDGATAILKSTIRPGDYVLLKGSRAIGMETLVAKLSIPSASN